MQKKKTQVSDLVCVCESNLACLQHNCCYLNAQACRTYADPFYSLPAPDYDKSCWFDEKSSLGMEFPNVSMTWSVCTCVEVCLYSVGCNWPCDLHQLPYLEDGDRKIVQSNAIMRYIARKHNMCKWKLFLFFLSFYQNWNKPSLLKFFTFRSVLCCVSVLISLMSSQAARRRTRRSESTSWRTSQWIWGTALSGCATLTWWVRSPESVIVDIRASTNATFGFFDPQEKQKPGYIKSLPEKLKQFSAFLGERKWFAGENVRLCVCACVRCMNSVIAQFISVFSTFSLLFQKITFVDFIMYELLDQHRMFHPSCLDAFDNIKGLMDRFEVSTCNRCRHLPVWWMHKNKLVLHLCYFRLWKKLLPTWSPTDSSRLLSTTRWPTGETKKSNSQIASTLMGKKNE